MRKLESHKKYSEEFDFEQLIEQEKIAQSLPNISNQWKISSFKLQISKSHNEHIYS